jgi:O-antigen ligase
MLAAAPPERDANETKIPPPSKPQKQGASQVSRSAGAAYWLERGIFVLLLLLALSIPFSTKAAVLFFRVALLLWTARLALPGRRLKPQPLLAPLAGFLLWTALSSAFSYEPAASWGRMRTVSMLLLAVLVTQCVARMRDLRWLASALLVATLANVCVTGWQYTYGIGVEVQAVAPESVLEKGHLPPEVIIESLGGKRVHSPGDVADILSRGAPQANLLMRYRHGAPPEHAEITLKRADLYDSLMTEPNALTRGHPVRAQGFYSHYIPYAEFLLLAGTLVWGMLLASGLQRRSVPWLWLLFFSAIGMALLATVTRAALAALMLACLLALWKVTGWKGRVAGLLAVALLAAAVPAWFHQERGQGWFSRDDAGTQYRLLMWQDGIRLAREHPLLGVGMDSIYRHAEEFGLRAYQRYPTLKSHFHSSYIQVAAECGLPALAAWLWLLGAGGVFLVRLERSARSAGRFARGLALGVLAMLAGFAALSVVHYSLGDAEVMILFWLLLGMAFALHNCLATDARTGQSTN